MIFLGGEYSFRSNTNEGGHAGGLRQVNTHSRMWPSLAFDWMERIEKEDM